MSDDWRLRVDLHEDGPARALTEHLGESALEHDLDTSFYDRVVVSREGAGVFCYTGSKKQAQEAERLVHAVAANLGWHVDAELTRWHPSTEEWRNADEPLSQDDLERAAQSAAVMACECDALEERGRPEFEVWVQCPSPREALHVLETLRGEGLPCARRSSYLLVGAPDEDSADALAQRLRRESPEGCVVLTEATLCAASTARRANPFLVLADPSPAPGSTARG